MTTALPKPTLRTRLAALLAGEVSAETVEAYRVAGRRVYEDLLAADAVRHTVALEADGLWVAPVGVRTQLLGTWNAFALQSLGEAFVDADYAHDPRTVGYLPRVTAEQAARFLGEVEYWSTAARRGAADGGYDLSRHVPLPAPLPAWVTVEPCPPPHLEAMLAAARVMRERSEHALADFLRSGVPMGKESDVDTLSGLSADAASAVDYAASLYSPRAAPGVHERVEVSLRRGIEGIYRLGQLLAWPQLLSQPAVVAAVTHVGTAQPLPGQPGFDPWVLTDPQTRAAWKNDREAVAAVSNLWRHDPDPARTLQVQAQIDAALAAGDIAQGVTKDGRRIGNFYCCPWSAIYVVRRPVVIGDERLRPGEQFTFDVSAEEVVEGGAFKRQILRGPFSVTSEVDYCNPAAGRGD